MRQIAASFLAGGARDPRITGLVTVTRVDVTADLSRAVIHYTVHGDAEVQAKTAEGLANAASAVRREVARSLKLRIVPEIVFAADAGHQHASRIEELLAQLRREGEAAGGETTAGDDSAGEGTAGEGTDGGGTEGEVGGEG